MMPALRDHSCESWEWDTEGKSPDAHLSPCRQAVYFHISPLLESQGTAGVRGTKGKTPGSAPERNQAMRVVLDLTDALCGIFQDNVSLTVSTTGRLSFWSMQNAGEQFINLIGMDTESWGLSYKGFLWHNGRSRKYTEPFYDRNTVIGVLLDRTTGTLTFYRNGENLGLAFSDLDQVGSALYPMVSSTAPETELQLGLRTSRLSSLQEHCIHTITHCLGHLGHTHLLPLPRALRFQIHTYSIRI